MAEKDYKFRIDILGKELAHLNSSYKAEKRKSEGHQRQLDHNKQFLPSSNLKKNLIESSKNYITGAGLEIYQSQLENHGRDPKGRRYTEKMKVVSYALRKKSPSSYRLWSEIFIMPSQSTLDALQAKVTVETGLCESILRAIEKKVTRMTEMEKWTVLCVDEMSLKAMASYRKDGDFIEGFEDNGPFGRSNEYASQALVIHIHGLVSSWKQPIGHVVSNGPAKADILHKLLRLALKRLREIGLKVRAVVSVQGSTNKSLFVQKKYFGITVEQPFFYDDGQKIYATYDPPHLLKSVRNNLMEKVAFKIDSRDVATWEDFQKFYDTDSGRDLRVQAAPKLSAANHVSTSPFKKMRVKFAAQVFSGAVSAGMKTLALVTKDSSINGQRMADTAETFKLFDNMFDCFNSSRKTDSKPYKCAITAKSQHWDLLEEARIFFEKVECWGADKKGIMKLTRPPCFNGWLLAISCLKQLSSDLYAEGLTYLTTRNLNQDPLENLFAHIRHSGGDRENPSVGQFRESLRYMMISACLDLHHHAGTNCEMDVAQTLFDSTTVSSLPTERSRVAEDEPLDFNDTVNEDSMRDFPSDLMQANVLYYIAGRCTTKFTTFHDSSCSCIAHVQVPKLEAKLSCENQVLTLLKVYDSWEARFGGLSVPTASFLQFITALNGIFEAKFDEIPHEFGVLREIHSKFMENANFDWFPVRKDSSCMKALDRAIRFFITMRIFYCYAHITKELANMPKKKENRKYKKLVNL